MILVAQVVAMLVIAVCLAAMIIRIYESPSPPPFSEAEAIALAKSGIWQGWTAEEKVSFQLFEDRLCMPFDVFHGAMEEVLGRPVWTHEFAFVDLLRKEYRKRRHAPTISDIMGLLPKDKVIVVETGSGRKVRKSLKGGAK